MSRTGQDREAVSRTGQEFRWRGDPTWRDPKSWRLQALCRDEDPRMWFEESADGEGIEGKRTCCRCPVRVECLEYALTVKEPAGVWGGLDTRQRESVHRHRLAVLRRERAS